MNSELPRYLRESAGAPFAWGDCDCCTWTCDWVARVIGVDPAARWRGACASEADAERIIAEGGGILALARVGCAGAGLVETRDPLPGDIGVVLTPLGEAMAIKTRIGWAMKTKNGVAAARVPMLAAWRVEGRLDG